VQQQELLQTLDGKLPTIVMGDFSFRPDTDQYRLTQTRFDDAWLLHWPIGVDDQARTFTIGSITSLCRQAQRSTLRATWTRLIRIIHCCGQRLAGNRLTSCRLVGR
jgi:endonuclease/exonuclease/phosphatase family metal-dependent hydrolase